MFIRLTGYLKLLVQLNIFKTVYFNFKVFPWSIAKKFPVFFFGPVKFNSLSGEILIDSKEISRGMIRFGCTEENIIASKEPTRISIDGKLIFHGKSKFALAIQLLVWNNGELIFGDNSWVGSFSKIVCFRSITIGNDFLGSWECQLFDTDFHFIENTNNNSIADTNGSIMIGNRVWLSSRTTVLKNTIIPQDCIISIGSLCNNDYSTTCPPGSVIGGQPAKLLKTGFRYIADKELEKKLFRYFNQTTNFNTELNRDLF